MHAMMFIIIKRHHCFFQGRDSTQLENVDCLVGKEKQRLAVSHRSADRLPSYISLPRHTKWRMKWINGPKVMLVVEKMAIL